MKQYNDVLFDMNSDPYVDNTSAFDALLWKYRVLGSIWEKHINQELAWHRYLFKELYDK